MAKGKSTTQKPYLKTVTCPECKHTFTIDLHEYCDADKNIGILLGNQNEMDRVVVNCPKDNTIFIAEINCKECK